MKLAFYIFLFLSITLYFQTSSACNTLDCIKSIALTRGDADSHQCPDLKKQLDIDSECGCDGSGNDTEDSRKLELCAKKECRKKCRSHISQNLFCPNLISSHNPCSECNQWPPVFSAGSREMSQLQSSCAKENRATIQQELMKKCDNQLANLAEGRGELICPNGTAQNTNCDVFCEKSVQEAMSSNCSDVTSETGFKKCRDESPKRLTQQVLPRTQEELAQKGFSFQNCALNLPCEQSLAQVFQTNLNQCQQLKQKASLCCSEPLKCQPSQSALFTGNVTATSSISESCRQLGQKLSQVGAVGQKMAEECAKSATHCQNQCAKAIKTGIQSQFYEVCAFDLNDSTEYSPATHTCDKMMIQKYARQYKEKLFPLIAQCAGEGKKAQNLAQTAEGLLKSAFSAQACHQSASAGLANNSSTTDPKSDSKGGDAKGLPTPSAPSGTFSSTQQKNDAVQGGGRHHWITYQVFPAKEPDRGRALAIARFQKKGFPP